MERRWWWKFSFLAVCTVFAAAYVYPTFFVTDLEKSKFPVKQKINLGLDLQGGLYLVMGIDLNKAMKDKVERQAFSLVERLKEKGFTPKGSKLASGEGIAPEDPQFIVEFEATQKDGIRELIKKEFWNLRLTDEQATSFRYGLSLEQKTDMREKTVQQSIEVIRNRIDEFGVSEPGITSQGADRIVIELPGLRDVERAKALIGRTAKLEFKIVDEKSMAAVNVGQIIADIEKAQGIKAPGLLGELPGSNPLKFSEYVTKINEGAKGKIPEGTMIAFERNMGPTGALVGYQPFILFTKADITGEDLNDAHVTLNTERANEPAVSFNLNPRGAAVFDRVTGEHLRERMAIVLDNTVYSAPVIQTRISGGSGQITLGQGAHDKLMREASDLSIVLRAGALPAQLEFLEQRVVGPQLGADSIQKGAFAAILGTLFVFAFVLVYYRVSGVIAVVSLLLNVLFVLAIFVGLEATLTLPGIAGIGLTVGIAVDSNVVIYERIREELALGKHIRAAVHAGFDKAFRTILDANVANAAAAIVLMNFGTGPIKGFAVTLLIGIVTTLFTAVFVCRMLFDLYLRTKENQPGAKISI